MFLRRKFSVANIKIYYLTSQFNLLSFFPSIIFLFRLNFCSFRVFHRRWFICSLSLCRFGVYRTNFGAAEWKLQRLCWSRCNTTRPTHTVKFILLGTRFGRFISSISAWNAAGTCTCQSWNYISISSKFEFLFWWCVVSNMDSIKGNWKRWKHYSLNWYKVNKTSYMLCCLFLLLNAKIETNQLNEKNILLPIGTHICFLSFRFDSIQTYADEGHDLTNVLEHVYKSMEYYLKDCLSLDPDDTKSEGADSST